MMYGVCVCVCVCVCVRVCVEEWLIRGGMLTSKYTHVFFLVSFVNMVDNYNTLHH